MELPRYIEVETSRRCNRVCSWCPNGSHATRREQELMPWPLYDKIARELGELGYGGWWAYHNYNEPLLNPRLKREIAHLREVVPDARPTIYTNGDRLTPDLLRDLLGLGVEYLRVTRYPKNANAGELPDHDVIRRWLVRRGLADQLDWRFVTVRQGLAAVWESGRTRVEVIRPRIAGYTNRGGTVTSLPVVRVASRTAPCLMTATSASVDYLGRLKMCCNVYPDSQDHARYVVGSLWRTSFADLWFGESMAEWRERHARADWSTSPACVSCTQQLPETRR